MAPRPAARRGSRARRQDGPLVVKLVGPSGAGKTTLAESLLRALCGQGLRVGYVKHAAHGFELDRPGKDSARAAAAGACGVALAGPAGIAYLAPEQQAAPEALAARFFADADLVLVEGFSQARVPTILFCSGRAARPAGRKAARLRAKPAPAGPVLAHVWPTEREADRDRSGVPALARSETSSLASALVLFLSLGAAARPQPRRSGRTRRRARTSRTRNRAR
ncbi:MAG: molybdopterin-guanine dinucleotide biosynthesis protein B [Planctomycetia bacterium]